MNILYTESSLNTGGQELQAVAQMAALMRAGHKVCWPAGREVVLPQRPPDRASGWNI